MPRKRTIETARAPGSLSKAQIFEELIQKVLGKNVKLEVEKVEKLRNKDFSIKREDSDSRRRPAEAPGPKGRPGAPAGHGSIQ